MTNKTTYLGIHNLKREGVNIDWSPEMVEEFIKCSEDPIYFIEKYMKIIHVDHGMISFKLYPFQKEMINSMHHNRNTIINTGRQIGKSTSTIGFILWYTIFNADKTVALLANKGDTAREILQKYHLAYQYLPKFLQQGALEWNKGSIVLENNSRVIATSSSADSIRGYAISLLFIDEMAFVENWEEFSASTLPTIISGKTTKTVFVSTPNGLNHFYKYWTEALKGANDYNPIKVIWSDVPGRDQAWKKATLSLLNNDYDKFAQENEAEFLGSSGTLIRGVKLKTLVSRNPVATRVSPITGRVVFQQYVIPEQNHAYAITVDSSEGKGLDYSAFNVIDITKTPYIQCATYRDNMITPGDYAAFIFHAAKAYNNAYILVENNNIGYEVARQLHEEHEYELMLWSGNNGRGGKKLSSGFGEHTQELGVKTSKTVKTVGCSMLKLLIEEDGLIINDFETIHELSRFSKHGNSYEAEAGAHDDLVMSLVLFGWMSKDKVFADLTNINTVQSVRDNTDKLIEEQLCDFVVSYPKPPSDIPVAVRGNDHRWLLDDENTPYEPPLKAWHW